MPAITTRTRYVACALARIAMAFFVMAALWTAAAIVLIGTERVKPGEGGPLLVVAFVALVIGWPWLARELIADMGPWPQPKLRAPLDARWRRYRAHRAARAHRRARVFLSKAVRVEELARRAHTRTVLNSQVLARPLHRLLTEDLARVQTADASTRASFDRAYQRALDHLAPDAGRIALTPTALTPAARLLFLTALVGLGDGHFDRLDLSQSELTAGRYVFVGAERAVDIAAWQRAIPTIAAVLGGRWRVVARDGVSLSLERLVELPASFPLTLELLHPGQLFLGRDLATGLPYHLPLSQLTHTMVVGGTGYGKSTLLHQIVAQLARQPEVVEHVHLVDLKHGLEFAAYRESARHLTVVERYQDLPALLANLTTSLTERIAATKAQRLTAYPGRPILVIIDEFAQIMLEPDTKAGREHITDGFVRLGNQARAAGIVLWVQVQHAVAETLPTALRRNLAATISFRQPSAQAAALIFGDTGDFPVDITRLARGQLLFRHGLTSEITALQAAHVGLADISNLSNIA